MSATVGNRTRILHSSILSRIYSLLTDESRFHHRWGIILQDTHCTYKRNIEERSRNHYCRAIALSITHSECVSVALVVQSTDCMRRFILSSVTCLSAIFFPTLSHKRRSFREKVVEHKMCVLICCTTFVWNISHSENNWAGHDKKKLFCSSCKVPVILVRF